MYYGEIEGGGFEVIEPEFAQTFVGHARLERLYTGCRWAEGVLCFNPDGRLIGRIRVPEMVANLTFGGTARNRLFICGTTSLYAIYLKING
jgi:gluconolactonase